MDKFEEARGLLREGKRLFDSKKGYKPSDAQITDAFFLFSNACIIDPTYS